MDTQDLSPDVAEKILDADFQNIVKKVAAGKPLTVAERIFAAASLLKDSVNRIGDQIDDGKANSSFRV